MQLGTSSIYHGLQTKLERRFSSGFSVLAAYTFGKAIDDNGVAWSRPQDPRDRRANRGLADFDTRHRLVVSALYELPIGPGKALLGNSKGVVKKLAEGWRVAAIGVHSTGFAFTPSLTFDVANVGLGNYTPRPNRIGNGTLSSQSVARWWDPTAFSAPAQNSFGNAGRNFLMGPGQNNWDFSLLKDTAIGERFAVEFRAECFNVLNITNFGTPNTQALTPLFGQIFSASPPRIVQFGLKVRF